MEKNHLIDIIGRFDSHNHVNWYVSTLLAVERLQGHDNEYEIRGVMINYY